MAKKGKGPATLEKRLKPSDKLASVIGKNYNITQQEAINLFWDYVKKNNLQDGDQVKLDEKLKALCEGVQGVDISSGKITKSQVGTIVSKQLTPVT